MYATGATATAAFEEMVDLTPEQVRGDLTRLGINAVTAEAGRRAETGVFPAQHGVFPAQHGVFPAQHGVFPAQHGVFPAKSGVFATRQTVFPAALKVSAA
jgi:hypothetical protein